MSPWTKYWVTTIGYWILDHHIQLIGLVVFFTIVSEIVSSKFIKKKDTDNIDLIKRYVLLQELRKRDKYRKGQEKT